MAVSTESAIDIYPQSAVLIGAIEDLGNGVIKHGHCWNILPNPTIDDYSTQLGRTDKVGEYKSIVEHLIPDTEYYVRSYVCNGELIKYGNEISLITSPPRPAKLVTGKVRNATKTSAEVISLMEDIGLGCDTVFRYGHCWSLSPEPSIYDSIHEFKISTDTTTFISQMTGLNPGTEYYIKPYALNAAGLAYGNQISFTTISPILPTIITGQVRDITHISATVNGSIEDIGAESNGVQQYGHCWSLNDAPTINDSLTTFGITSKKESFSSSLSNLKPGITYHVRGYAINEAGIVYGELKSFTTTELTLATLNTGTIRDITTNSAVIMGSISNLGNAIDSITSYGHCWRINAEPTIFDSINDYGIKTSPGDFLSSLNNLQPGGNYFIKAYAVSEAGISYGETVSFFVNPELPIISTIAPTNIDYNNATTAGIITYNGGVDILASGICWSTSISPTVNDNKTTDGSLEGSFQSEINELSPGTTYYLRAYATNAAGTAYGDEFSITTISPKVPEITTIPVSGDIYAKALSGGNITDGGGYAVTAKGLCWSTSPNPTLRNNTTTELSGTNYFTSTANNLKCDSTYYLRAYATNAMGTTYGEEIEFTATRLFDYDGNSYKWVQIGEQIWMAENLKTTHYSDGTPITDGTGLSYFEEGKFWSYPNEDNSNKDIYGLYYSWYATVRDNISTNSVPSGTQGICPTGWHVPSIAEFDTLTAFVGGEIEAGWMLKSTNNEYWISTNIEVIDLYGFSAIGSGAFEVDRTKYFKDSFLSGTATSGDNQSTWISYLLRDDESYSMPVWLPKHSSMHTIRCLKY